MASTFLSLFLLSFAQAQTPAVPSWSEEGNVFKYYSRVEGGVQFTCFDIRTEKKGQPIVRDPNVVAFSKNLQARVRSAAVKQLHDILDNEEHEELCANNQDVIAALTPKIAALAEAAEDVYYQMIRSRAEFTSCSSGVFRFEFASQLLDICRE